MKEYKSFKVSIENKIASVAFNIPLKANSLNKDAWQEMHEIFDKLSGDKKVRVIILSGEGNHFCAGIELETLMNLQTGEESDDAGVREGIRKFIYFLQNSISAIEKCRKPVIAAIHNGCIGGGVDIVSACDIRYCNDDAYFTIKEVDLGLVADIGTIQRLPTIINPGIMAELAYTGRKVYGPEAEKIGLVNKSFSSKEEMMSEVMKIASTIAKKSPLVIRGTKEALLYKRDHTVKDSLDQIAIYNSAMLLSDDLMESFQAFMLKKEPEYKDS